MLTFQFHRKLHIFFKMKKIVIWFWLKLKSIYTMEKDVEKAWKQKYEKNSREFLLLFIHLFYPRKFFFFTFLSSFVIENYYRASMKTFFDKLNYRWKNPRITFEFCSSNFFPHFQRKKLLSWLLSGATKRREKKSK